jgi:hypothetical protein
MSNYQNLSRVIQIAVSIFLLYCAFFTTQNLESTVLDKDDLGSLGFYLVGIIFLSLTPAALGSSAVVKKWGNKKCLFYGAFGHSMFVAANILPAYRLDYPRPGNCL